MKAPFRRGLPLRLARTRRNWYIDGEVRSPFRPFCRADAPVNLT